MADESKQTKPDILERTIRYSLRIIRLFRVLERDSVGRVIGNQLLRSGTSIGANIHEAQGGKSKADFIAKMTIAHKEARESAYWLRVIQDAKIVSESNLAELRNETDEIIKVLSSILISAKKKK